jgi:hypothetical protein
MRMFGFVLYIIKKKRKDVDKIMLIKRKKIPFKYICMYTIKKNHSVRHPYKKYFQLFI